MITVYRGDRRVIAWQTQEEAIAWCKRNQLSDDWTKDYTIQGLIRDTEFYTWALGPELHMLLLDGDRSLAEISAGMGLEAPAVLGHLKRWMALGWLKRYRSASDRRIKVYGLTPKGRLIRVVHAGTQQSVSRCQQITYLLTKESPLSVPAIAKRLNLEYRGVWYAVRLLTAACIVEQYGHKCYLRGHHEF